MGGCANGGGDKIGESPIGVPGVANVEVGAGFRKVLGAAIDGRLVADSINVAAIKIGILRFMKFSGN